MPDKRIGTVEAARILGCSLTHARECMRGAGADIRRERRKGNPCVRMTYLKSEVEAYVNDVDAFERAPRHSKADETRKLVEWADGLRRWPSDKAINERTSDVYRVTDVEGVIDTRVFRLKDPRPADKTADRYLRALRNPSMVREGTNGMRIA